MARLTRKRLIAGLLPLSFLWAFIACVAICERESLGHTAEEISGLIGINAVKEVPHCDGCPISYFPKATAAERAKFVVGLRPLATFDSVISSVNPSHQSVVCDRLDRPLSNSSPPLKLLSALRI